MNKISDELMKKLTAFGYFFRPDIWGDEPEEITRKRQTCAFDEDYILDMENLMGRGDKAAGIMSCLSAFSIKNQWSKYIDDCLFESCEVEEMKKAGEEHGLLLRLLELRSPEVMLTLMKVRYAVLARQTQVQLEGKLQLEENLNDSCRATDNLRNEIRSLNTAIEKKNAKIKALQQKDAAKKNDDSKDIKKLNKIINDNRETIKSQRLEIQKLRTKNQGDEVNQLKEEVKYLRASAKGECSICFLPYSKTAEKCCLHCGHQFCLSCIEQMMKHLKFECPTCRKDFQEDEIIKLF